MKKCSRKILIATASLSLILLSGCVSQTKYDDLNAQYQQLQAAFNDDQAEIVLLKGELKVTMLDGVLFSEGGYTLNQDSKDILNKLVPTLTGLKETKIIVDGFTDNVPIGAKLKRQGIASNLELSSKRADVVVQYLLDQGINPDIIAGEGYGERKPAASNDTSDGRSKNRRIEVTLIGDGK